MSKELNALECLEALEQDIKDRTILAEDRQLKLCAVIKQALLELQSIKEANPSEALECLEKLKGMEISSMPFSDEYGTQEVDLNDIRKVGSQLNTDFREYVNTIQQDLLELQSIKKAKPSEALECLDKLVKQIELDEDTDYWEIRNAHITVEQALQRLEKYEQLCESKPSDEIISRAALCEAVKRIFGSVEKFLDIIEEDIPYGYHYYKYDGEEIYIIDHHHNKYINWYKLTHVGRDFHTDMKTKEEVIEFLQNLHNKWLMENEDE